MHSRMEVSRQLLGILFHLVGSRDGARVTRLGNGYLYPLSHLTGWRSFFTEEILSAFWETPSKIHKSLERDHMLPTACMDHIKTERTLAHRTFRKTFKKLIRPCKFMQSYASSRASHLSPCPPGTPESDLIWK